MVRPRLLVPTNVGYAAISRALPTVCMWPASVLAEFGDDLPDDVFTAKDVLVSLETTDLHASVVEYVNFHSLANKGHRHQHAVPSVTRQHEVDVCGLKVGKEVVERMGHDYLLVVGCSRP